MKIHLIFAPTTFSLNYGDLGKGVGPPLGILYIAAYLRKYNSPSSYDITITDGLLDGYDKTLDIACEVGADIIGISAVTHNILGAYKLIDTIKERLPGSKIILGGPHPTAMPEEAFERSTPDVVVVGEGEETFRELVCSYEGGEDSVDELKRIDGICIEDDSEVITTSTRKFISDLDTLPFPARDLVDMKRYNGYPMSRGQKSTIFLSSRGCPFSCTFCSDNVWKTSTPRFRTRSPKNIADELQELTRQGFDGFFDQSDEFNSNLEHAKAVLREIISRDLEINLQCQFRAKPVDDELVSLMKKAGFWYIHLGIESGNAETLVGVKKKVTLEDVEHCCAILQGHGIRIWGLFMFFNIWEDNGNLFHEDYDKSLNTLEYAKELYKKKLINFFGGSITTPIPGSPLWDTALRHNLIKEECLGNYDLWFFKRELRLISKVPGVPETDIFKLHQKTYKFTIRSLMKERVITISNLPYAFIRAAYFIKKDLILLFKRFVR
jgi:radical SAM superfamily enzyme YgiQ (UPF0313 family)